MVLARILAFILILALAWFTVTAVLREIDLKMKNPDDLDSDSLSLLIEDLDDKIRIAKEKAELGVESEKIKLAEYEKRLERAVALKEKLDKLK